MPRQKLVHNMPFNKHLRLETVNDIELRNLSYTYPGQSVPALNKVSFTLTKGDWLWVLGSSGAGKSTLVRIMSGLQHMWENGTCEGKLRFNGQDITDETWHLLRGQIGAVFEDAESGLILEIVEDELAFAPENLGIAQDEIHHRVHDAAKQMKITELLPRHNHTLSGGQQQRVAIASMLTMQPSVWLLDDAAANLDEPAAETLLTLLRDLQKQGHIIVFCSSRWVAYEADDSMLLLEAGRCIANFRASDIATHQTNIVSQLLRHGCIPDASSVTHLQNASHLNLTAQTPMKCDQMQNNKPLSQENMVLQTHKLNFSYGEVQVLHHIDLSLSVGNIIMVTGNNGAGKSTLGKIIAGLLPCRKGMLFITGQDTTAMSAQERAQKIGYGFQQPEHQFIAPTVLEECVYGLLIQQGSDLPRSGVVALPEHIRQIGMEMLNRFELADKHLLDPHQLSASDKRLLVLAALLITKPRLLILDEPTAGLDYKKAARLMNVVNEYVKQNDSAAVIITHDIYTVSKIATCELRLS